MSWRHRIAGAILVVLAGLPIEATFCAFRCASSTRVLAVHHGEGRTCDDAAPDYADSQIGVVPMDDCSSHGTVRQVATTVAERADTMAKPVVSVIATVHIAFRSFEDATFFSASPPGTAPPTTPAVLRI